MLIRKSFKKYAFVVKIQNTIREVGSTTDQVASAAEELSRVANETRTSVQEQGSETDQIVCIARRSPAAKAA